MNRATRSGARVIIGASVLLLGSVAPSAQAVVDGENNYSNVGAIMVWRFDDSGKPVQLMAFASGTLIQPRVMVTAGHVTAPTRHPTSRRFPRPEITLPVEVKRLNVSDWRTRCPARRSRRVAPT
jgi:hypothetical protein